MSRLSLLSRNVSTLALLVVCAFGLATPAAMRGGSAGTAATWTYCTIAVTGPCFAFDMVAGPTSGGWSLSFGTSAAAPHVAGVAALVIGMHGRRMPPSEVKTLLQSSADDLGMPGVDAFYGHGRVNAARAVGAW